MERVNGETIAKGFGHYLPADNIPPFKDENLPAFLRKIPRSDKSIVPRANDDVIVSILCHRNLLFLLEECAEQSNDRSSNHKPCCIDFKSD